MWGRGVLYVWYLTQTYVILKSKILNFFCANSQFATYSIQLSAVAIRWKFFLNQNKIFFVNFFSLFYKNYILMMIQKETCLGFGRTVQARTIYSEFKQLIWRFRNSFFLSKTYTFKTIFNSCQVAWDHFPLITSIRWLSL